MRDGGHKRQILLFTTAILLPAGTLIGVAARSIHQERELAGKRVADERLLATDQVRRELADRLEAIRLQEINRLIRSPGARWMEPPGNQAVVFIAKAEADTLVLPWDVGLQTQRPASPEFAQVRQEGERQEFATKDYAAATVLYRRALASAGDQVERADARLLLARTLAKAGNAEEASRHLFALLKESGDARDEHGVRFRLYAAERLLEAKREQAPVLSFLLDQAGRERSLTPPEAAMIRSLLAAIPGPQADSARASLSRRVADVEQASALAKDFQLVRAQIESSPSSGTVWIPYGGEPWLVAIVPAAPPLPALLMAVSSAKAAPRGVKLGGRGFQGSTLGDSFPGLQAQWPANRFSPATGGPMALYIGVVGLVLGLTVLGGYVVVRDVHRDIQFTEVRSQFVASVSHELKTPLTSIRMFAETLSLGRCRDERIQYEYLETIVNESERLARLVDNVLDFSKIEQGKKIYRLRPTNLAAVADSAVRAMQYPLSQQGFSLRLSIAENLPPLRADPDALEQAILNLLTNAMKYSGDAREIDLRLVSRNGDAVIEVTDRGQGIAPEEQKHVFEKFYRSRSYENSPIAGTGLGLTLVAHIAKAHGGHVELQSAPGAGSTFSILLPFEVQA
jgi:Histidine kinase-, DNA gyrase B-, and HSP90-like ATPase/His Kinase A (phospho-acceptor) domain/Tetratricopeptide repeat